MLRILREHLDLACLSNLQVLRIDGIELWIDPGGSEHLPEIMSQIASEHMTKITLQVECHLRAVDKELASVDWMSLAHILTQPRFARLQRVEIIVWIPHFYGPDSQADEWVNKVRADMGVLDSQGGLFVSVH
jgi:hypothetical protein